MKKKHEEVKVENKEIEVFDVRNLPIEIREILKGNKYYVEKEYLSQAELVDVLKQAIKKEMNHHKKQDLDDKLLKTVIAEKILLLTKNEKETVGQKAADTLSSFGGSWRFIICYFVMLDCIK